MTIQSSSLMLPAASHRHRLQPAAPLPPLHPSASSCSPLVPEQPLASLSPSSSPSLSSCRLSARGLTVVVLCLLLLTLLCPSPVSAGRDFYKILGLKRDAKAADIKKAYRALSKQLHPDKNPGDEAAHQSFLDVSAAYEVLSDKEKRRVYDQVGEDGLKEREKQKAGGGGGDPFGGLFGGMFGRRTDDADRRGDDIVLDLVVTLDELYNGASKEVRVHSKQLCEHCRGTGADSESDISDCRECGGKGHTIIMQPIGPGFMQQIQQQCPRCGGKGKIVTKQCHVCKGRKLSNGQRTLDIQVEQGMTDDSRIEFEHAADESPDIAAGHVIFKIVTAPHSNFTRRGKDLHFTQRLSLLEALTGFDTTVRQLDGRLISIRSDDVTPHGHVMRVKGEGMPVHTVPSQRGDLYVKFAVELPKTLTNQQKEGFAEILKNVR